MIQPVEPDNLRFLQSLNEAIFENILVREGRIVEVQYRELFEPVLGTPEFEQRSLELQTNYLPPEKVPAD